MTSKTLYIAATFTAAVVALVVGVAADSTLGVSAGLGLAFIALIGAFFGQIKELSVEGFDLKALVRTWSPGDLRRDPLLPPTGEAVGHERAMTTATPLPLVASDRLSIITLSTHRYLDLFTQISEFDGRHDLFEEFNGQLLNGQYVVEGVPRDLARRIADGIMEWVAAGHVALEEYAPGMVAGPKKRQVICRLFHAAYEFILDHRVIILDQGLTPACDLLVEEANSWVNRRHLVR